MRHHEINAINFSKLYFYNSYLYMSQTHSNQSLLLAVYQEQNLPRLTKLVHVWNKPKQLRPAHSLSRVNLSKIIIINNSFCYTINSDQIMLTSSNHTKIGSKNMLAYVFIKLDFYNWNYCYLYFHMYLQMTNIFFLQTLHYLLNLSTLIQWTNQMFNSKKTLFMINVKQM